jgi:hypothetical protein
MSSLKDGDRVLHVGDYVAWKFRNDDVDTGCLMLRDHWYEVKSINPVLKIFTIIASTGRQTYFSLSNDIIIRNNKSKIDYFAITKDIVG